MSESLSCSQEIRKPSSGDVLPDYVRFVLSHFRDVQEISDGWICRCPIPDHGRGDGDHNPSLRISVGEAGRLLVCCRTGCPTRAVLTAADLRFSDLFPGDSDVPLEPRCHEVVEPTDEEKVRRNRVYRFLLSRLALSPDDRQALLDRGLSRQGIEGGLYRTLAPGCLDRNLSEHLLREFGDRLYSVPGFVPRDGQVGLATTATGLLIPVTDVVGQVVALKIRRHQVAEGEPRYCYLSGGEASSGAPYHWPLGFTYSDTVRVTEGEIKAHIATEKTGLYTVSIPGVSNWRRLLPELQRRGVRRVVVAFDWPDVRENRSVFRQWDAFREDLLRTGTEVAIEIWADLSKKGIDDALEAEQEIEVIEGEQLAQAVRALQAHHGGITLSSPNPASIVPGGVCEAPQPATSADSPPARLAPYPIDVFPQYVQDIINAVKEAVGCSRNLVIAPVISAVARAVASVWSTQEMTQAGSQRSCIYGVTVSEPGTGKGPAARYVLRETYRHDKTLDDRAPLARAVVGDLTVEGLRRTLVAAEQTKEVGGTLVHADELTGLIGGMDQFKGGKGNDRQFFLSAWDAVPLPPVIRAGSVHQRIERPSLCILGNISPDRLYCLDDKRNKGDGFIARFLFHLGDPWRPREIASFEETLLPLDDPRQVAWDRALQRLHAFVGPVTLRLSPEAKQAWVDGLNRHARVRQERQLCGEMAQVWSKFPVQAARLMIVLHAMQVASSDDMNPQETPVSAETVRNAWRLADYYLDAAAYVFERIRSSQPSTGPEDNARDLYRKIVDYSLDGPDGFTVRELHQKVRGTRAFKHSEAVATFLDQLVKGGKLRRIDHKRYQLVTP
jgi:hypothetical protein